MSALLGNCSSFAVGMRCAVAGAAEADPLDQVVGVDGDDDGGGDTPGVGDVGGPQLPVTEIFQGVEIFPGVVAALPVGPAVDRAGH